MKKIWAVIVTYNPDINRLKDNIEAIVKQVCGVVVVDNASNNVNDIIDIINKLKNENSYDINVISNDCNKGIASALNIGIKTAYENKNADWIITLDQDTVVYDNIIKIYKEFYFSPYYNNSIVSFSCLRKDRNYNEKNNSFIDEKGNNDYEFVKCCITSGNLINVSAWKKINGFDDKLFIDMVDDDFCIRLRINNYKIVRINKYGFLHELGDSVKKVKLFGREKVVIFCNSMRKYYLARNTTYIVKKYKLGFNSEYNKYLFKRITGTILFEKNKVKGLKAYIKGIRDSKKLICTK